MILTELVTPRPKLKAGLRIRHINSNNVYVLAAFYINNAIYFAFVDLKTGISLNEQYIVGTNIDNVMSSDNIKHLLNEANTDNWEVVSYVDSKTSERNSMTLADIFKSVEVKLCIGSRIHSKEFNCDYIIATTSLGSPYSVYLINLTTGLTLSTHSIMLDSLTQALTREMLIHLLINEDLTTWTLIN